jgi:hypothetical protein
MGHEVSLPILSLTLQIGWKGQKSGGSGSGSPNRNGGAAAQIGNGGCQANCAVLGRAERNGISRVSTNAEGAAVLVCRERAVLQGKEWVVSI